MRDLTVGQFRPIARLVRQGKVRPAFYRLQARLADLYNFHLRSRGGLNVQCPCCGWTGASFMATSNYRGVTYQSRCPVCDSRSRHRGLALLLPSVLQDRPEGPILVFAPELVMLNQLRQLCPNGIVTTDLNSVDVDAPGEDIQQLSFAHCTFAAIVCNHVLEHVPDDDRALSECARVLRPSGVAVFTVPVDSRESRTKRFAYRDDNGHLRHYGMDILLQMKRCFRVVEAIDMGTLAPKPARVRVGDYAFICKK